MATETRQAAQETPPAHVSFRGVQKTYDGENLIVRNLDLDIRRGEFITLLGPSGSGKTTCLMMLAGFETPTAGEIRLGDCVINRLPPHKRNIGMVFQNYALFPNMTVRENLRFPLSVRKFSAAEIDAKVKRALEMVQLGGFENRRPAQLSGGQQQRVALARALVFEPQLVLMDEPLGALDKQLREHMQLEIKHIHQTLGITFVFVTHDQGEALTMSDRIAVFNHGVIQQIDVPEVLYEKPANAFVASFIGENNALSGRIDSRTGDIVSVLLPDGNRIAVSAGDAGGPGSDTLVSIRPERVRLARERAPRDNLLRATVLEHIYLGDHVRLRMQVAGCDNFTMKTPISRLDRCPAAGEHVDLALAPEHLLALAA
ncbi:ABC transporter ATP-binding protein [Pseudothauera nasutitermitis]|uniref:ABC transporter ATP-binding protein n=1 Tax=Pseudothauera nasutitermitis TaxID=2565930 RepID=A0A4S4B373_9RHOO|nr:ABC transporter ATP-binding protein [Pseudothauera nasutitermitis]THF67005.1 ABC transporter ATP-binding protein [Pseudothauera nasutitermitis]